jgi:hypothetical protein
VVVRRTSDVEAVRVREVEAEDLLVRQPAPVDLRLDEPGEQVGGGLGR